MPSPRPTAFSASMPGTGRTQDIRCVAERERRFGQSGKDGLGVSCIARVRITIGTIVREGVGSGHGIDADLGLAHESAIKEAETDAMKRALMSVRQPVRSGALRQDASERG